MATIYASDRNVIDPEVAGDVFRALLKHTDDIRIDSDEFGTFYEVPDEAYEKAFAPKKKRGRPRAADKVEEVAEESETEEVQDQE